MRKATLIFLAACGPAFAPVIVRVVNVGGDATLLVSGHAVVKLNPSCELNCELRGGLEDGGIGWTALPQQKIDAGAHIDTEPRPVALDAFVQTTVYYGISQTPGSAPNYTQCDAGAEGVPGHGMIVTVTTDGGACAFDYTLP